MAIVIYSVNTEEFKNRYVNMNNLHIYKALAASQLVINCGSLKEAREKFNEDYGSKFYFVSRRSSFSYPFKTKRNGRRYSVS